MAGRGIADVVFCLDSSASMSPTFGAIRDHIMSFLGGLKSDGQAAWDLRVDFVAHSASDLSTGIVLRARSMREEALYSTMYPSQGVPDMGSLFTSDIEEFRSSLGRLKSGGDETNLIALDACLDFPWRTTSDCHRVLIMLTDEPLETGLLIPEQRAAVPALIEKIHQLGVLLFIIGPESAGYDALAAANRSTYDVVAEGNGLTSVDFGKVLNQIGRSVSASRTNAAIGTVKRALFGQDRWGTTSNQEYRGA
jgi:hypothetical protein